MSSLARIAGAGAVTLFITQTLVAETTATFFPRSGRLLVQGDASANHITIGLDPTGRIVVNGGAVVPVGGRPTRWNTTLLEVHGGPGDDVLVVAGDLPSAYLLGDEGDDVLQGGDGVDVLRGGAGNDTLLGSRGNDVVQGDEGDDQILWNDGDDDDVIEGDDFLDAKGLPDGIALFAHGGDGNDVIVGGSGDDQLCGDAGRDHLVGGGGGDFLDGGADDDVLEGGDGDDTLFGGDGDDFLDGGAGFDVADGGPGKDRAVACERMTRIP